MGEVLEGRSLAPMAESEGATGLADFWDRQLRHGEHYGERWEYVRQNPVRAGFVKNADDWTWQGEMHELRW